MVPVCSLSGGGNEILAVLQCKPTAELPSPHREQDFVPGFAKTSFPGSFYPQKKEKQEVHLSGSLLLL